MDNKQLQVYKKLYEQEKAEKEALKEENIQLKDELKKMTDIISSKDINVKMLVDQLNNELKETREVRSELKSLIEQVMVEKNRYINRVEKAVNNIVGEY